MEGFKFKEVLIASLLLTTMSISVCFSSDTSGFDSSNSNTPPMSDDEDFIPASMPKKLIPVPQSNEQSRKYCPVMGEYWEERTDGKVLPIPTTKEPITGKTDQ